MAYNDKQTLWDVVSSWYNAELRGIDIYMSGHIHILTNTRDHIIIIYIERERACHRLVYNLHLM